MKLSQHVSVGGHSTKHNLSKDYRASLDHVQGDLTASNVTIRSEGLRRVYSELFGEAVEEYNAKQRRADRRIDDYYAKVRDDARGHKGVQNKDGKRLAYEQVVGIGNRDTFHASDPANVELAKRIYGEYVAEFESRFPNLRVFEAVIHVDELEGGIHLHNAYVPWGEGYKQGMSRQQSLSKACENMGFDHKELDARSRQLLEEVCLRHGIERLDVGNGEHHKPTAQFKQEQRELEAIRLEKDRARGEHFKQQRTLSAKRNTLQRSVGRLSAQETTLRKATTRIMATKRVVQAEVVQARAELEAARAELAFLLQAIAEAKRERDAMRERADEVLAQARALVRTLDEAVMQKSNEVEALVVECERLEGARDALKSEVAELEEEKGLLRGAIDSLRAAFERAVERIREFMPDPLDSLIRAWRDDDAEKIGLWHDSMDEAAMELAREIPNDLDEAIEQAKAANSARRKIGGSLQETLARAHSTSAANEARRAVEEAAWKVRRLGR